MRFVTRAPRSVFVVIVAALVVWATTLSPRLPVLRVADDAVVLAQAGAQPPADAGRPLKVLFLGQDQTTHSAAGLYQAIGAPLARHGIQLTAVLSPAALTADRVKYYDAILIYGNHAALTPDQEKVLADFVEGGKGIVALHSATEMFSGSARYTAMIGAALGAAVWRGDWQRVHRRDRPDVTRGRAGREAVRDLGRNRRPSRSRTRPIARC